MIKKLLFLLTFLTFFNIISHGQGTTGKDFWVAFLDGDFYCNTRTPLPGPLPGAWDEDTLELYISSQYAATVKIQIDTASHYVFSKTVVLVPNKITYVKVPSQIACRNFFSDVVANNGVHITSDSLINVQAVNRFWSSKGATTVIPTESIPNGPEYFITTNASPNTWACNIPFGGKLNKSAEFVAVGIAPVSILEVIPSGISSLNNNKRGIPFEVTLKQGETFQYITTDDDLTGSIIRSRDTISKFAVFAGNRMTYSENSDSVNSLCVSGYPYKVFLYTPSNVLDDLDHTYEQMFPAITLGKSYTALPFKNSFGGYYLKVLAVENETRIKIDGKFYKTIQQGDYFTLNVGRDTVRKITADKRISVTQFAKGTSCNKHPFPKVTMGDISQIQLVPDEQYVTSANINRVTNLYSAWINSNKNLKPENYLNVMVKESDTASFKINGRSVPSILWNKSSVMNTYRYVQLDIDTINYHLTSAKGFIAYVYGYGPYEGYAYAAAANFKPLNIDFVFNTQCKLDTITFTRIKNDSFVNYKWKFGDKTKILTGSEVTKIFKDSGWFDVTMYATQARTNRIDSIIKRIYIAMADQRPVLCNDTMICGKMQFVVYSKYFDLSKKYLWDDERTIYYREFRDSGQYWEKVTERNGCVFIDTLNIKNYPFPKAAFTTSDTVFCSNGTKDINFTNLSTSEDPVLFYNWDFGDLNINDTNKIVKHRYKKPDFYFVTLRVRTKHGCDDINGQLIEIKPSPLVNFSIISADTCLNSNGIGFVNNTVKDSANLLKFKWNFGDNNIIYNRNPLSPHVYPDSGKFVASLIYENKNGCMDTMSSKISIYKNPVSAFNMLSKGPCLKDSVLFFNKSTTAYKPLKSLWMFGDGLTDTKYNTAHLYKKADTFKVELIVQTPQGCRDTSEKLLKFNGTPIASFTINDSIQCLIDNKFIFANTSQLDSGIIISKKWRYSDGVQVSNKDTISRKLLSAGAYTLQLKVTSNLGCSDSVIRAIEVKNGPAIQISSNDFSQCLRLQNFIFNYVPKPGNDSIKGLTWYLNSDSIKNLTTISNIKFPGNGQYPVRLRVYSKFGCDGETSRLATVNPNPVAKFNVPTATQCLQGNSFVMVNQSSVSSGILTGFNWDYGDASNSVLQTPLPKTYTASGKYKIDLTVVSDSGCTDTAGTYVEIYPSAVIAINAVPEVCFNDTSVFSGSATVAGGTITGYLWDFGDNGSSIQQNTRHLYANPGTYAVKLTTTTDKNCKDSKTLNNWATVNSLPNPAFKYDIMEGKNNNSNILFSDLTKPKPVSLHWDFGPFGKSVKHDTTLSIIDTTTIRARLYVTDIKGCTGFIEKSIFVAPPGQMFFPNAFTANGDGINDGFGPQGVAFATNYKFTIYNRWGEIVFKSHELGETWNGYYNGALCQNGVYIYRLELNDFFGKYKKYEGSFLLFW